VWLRRPQRARAALGAIRHPDAESLALLSWLTLFVDRDEDAAAALAYDALKRPGDTRFASAALAEILLGAHQYDRALDVIAEARHRFSRIPWYDLTLADALVEAGRVTEAEVVLERRTSDRTLGRHALKRLSRLTLGRGDRARARRFLEELVGMAPNYLVYASDHVTLGRLQLEDGDRDAAAVTWRRGAETYPRNQALRTLLIEHFGDHGPEIAPRIRAVDENDLGARRIPVRTPLITPRSGVLPVVKEAIAGTYQPGDVVALAESATAIGQGRVLPLELIRPGLLATFLSRFVAEWGPLHSPAGMQGAVMEAGRLRIAVAAAAGAVGKALGRRGWFYRVAGHRTAMIDDVAGCLPPYDHHVIFGPANSEALSAQFAADLGCPVAIVDANHYSGAAVIGASEGVDRTWLSRALADNPAGNEDEQTPVVLVRRLTA
jgi:tetratricopeptide (TPR) repeat protein